MKTQNCSSYLASCSLTAFCKIYVKCLIKYHQRTDKFFKAEISIPFFSQCQWPEKQLMKGEMGEEGEGI